MTSLTKTGTASTGKVADIMAEVQALPSADQEIFTKLFRDWIAKNEQQGVVEEEQKEPSVEWPDFAGRMKALFPNGPIPGDPQKFWDEMRRE